MILVAFFASDKKEFVSSVMQTVMHLAVLLGSITLIVVNWIIFRQVRRQVRLLQSLAVDQAEEMRGELTKRETRTAYLCFGMVATFICCWFPNAFLTIAHVANVEFSGALVFARISTTVFFSGLIINPIWYIFWKSDFRHSLHRIFLRILCRHNITSKIGFSVTAKRTTTDELVTH